MMTAGVIKSHNAHVTQTRRKQSKSTRRWKEKTINEGSSDDDCGGHKKSQCPSDTDKTKAEQVDEAMESKDAATQAAVTTCRSDRYRREMEKARV